MIKSTAVQVEIFVTIYNGIATIKLRQEIGGGKLNMNIRDAVSKWRKKAASIIAGAVGRMHLWQKAGLALCIIFWILSFIIGIYCERLTARMTDQNFASRWKPEGGSAQISTFISDGARLSEDSIYALTALLNKSFQEASIALSQTQIDNGAKLADICYCGFGSADLTTGEESLNVTAIGVGGDFFNFHPLDLMDGYYFAEDDLMKDRILLDDETAWRLFGSPFITGKIINVGGVPHVIAGVFRRPEGRFYKSSGMGNYLIFVSYDTLCRHTTAGSSDSDNSGENNDDSSLLDARAVPSENTGEESIIPQTAAWIPTEESSQNPAIAANNYSQKPDLTADNSGYVQFRDSRSEDGGVFSSSLSDEEIDESSSESGDNDSDSREDSSETSEGDADDSPADRDTDGGLSGGSGGYGGGDDGTVQKPEINKNRITCIEVVLPNPLSGYALRMVRSALSESGIDMEQVRVVDNSSRFNVFRLITMLAEPGVRSMQTAPIRYPYWENVSLAWEDVLIPYALLRILLRYLPVLFLLFLAMWYATHKSWTAGGVIKTIQDRIYDRQSERIYGKRQDNIPQIEKDTTADQGVETPQINSAEDASDTGAETAPDGGNEPSPEEIPEDDVSNKKDESETEGDSGTVPEDRPDHTEQTRARSGQEG